MALPKGSTTVIHKNTGISAPTIHRFFHGGRVKACNQIKIYKEALKIIENDLLETSKLREMREKLLGAKSEKSQ
ncbi:MAG: hypothetical protein IT236_19025 [Bacteroidia bacterium]|nr:hypothetical protein [Bacteroidia bacterium]